MLVPWALIGRLVLSLVVALLALRLRGVRGDRKDAAVDLALTLAVGAALGGRLTVLALDALLVGGLPDVRAVVTLGPGLSAPGALIGATVAGWRRRSVAVGTWQDAGLVVTAGLATFAASHLLVLPVPDVVRTLVLVGVAVRLVRVDPTRWHPGPRLLVGVATAHLLAAAVTPSLPTVDTDVDLLLTVVVVLAGLLTLPRVGEGARRLAGVVGMVVGGLVLVAVLTAADAPSLPADVDPAATAALDGAILAGADPGAADVPTWGAEELAALARDVDVPIVLNLWAAWCPPCHAEAPTVARAAEALRGRAVVIGVLVDDEVADGQAFADRYDLGFPTVVDAGLSDAIGMAGLPTTVILDSEGTVVRRVVGGLAQATLAEAVEAAARG